MVAINPGSLASHQRWSDKNTFGFPICVDTDKKVATAYGAIKANGGIQRTVVVVNPQGVVVWSREGLPATEEILEAIDVSRRNAD